MKKFLIGLGVVVLSLTGMSNIAGANGDHESGITVTCDTKLPRWIDVEDVAEYAGELYADVHDALLDAMEEDGNIDLNGGAPGGLVHVVITGDASGGTITVTDEGEVIALLSLSDGEFSFSASAEVEGYLILSVSFYKDRLGELCGDAPFTVCLSNTIFLVEAADLAEYLEANPTAVVVNSTVGCPGTPGEDGSDGSNGEDGSDGTDGSDGAAGPAGPAGQTVVVEKIVQVPVAAPVSLPRTA